MTQLVFLHSIRNVFSVWWSLGELWCDAPVILQLAPILVLQDSGVFRVWFPVMILGVWRVFLLCFPGYISTVTPTYLWMRLGLGNWWGFPLGMPSSRLLPSRVLVGSFMLSVQITGNVLPAFITDVRQHSDIYFKTPTLCNMLSQYTVKILLGLPPKNTQTICDWLTGLCLTCMALS